MPLPPFDDVLEALKTRPPITWQLTAVQGWIVLTQLQLALRHPHNTGASAQLVRELAQALQDAVAPDGVLQALAAAGWDPGQDVPVTPSDAPLTITMTPTDQLTEMSGAPMRVWEGRSADGVPCLVFVHRLAVPEGGDTAAFERALREQLPPGRVVPLRQIV